jgi:hypothetical protein
MHNAKTHRYVIDVDCADKIVPLPCNCDAIEAVTYFYEDWNRVTNDTPNGDYHSQFTENNIEEMKEFQGPLYLFHNI